MRKFLAWLNHLVSLISLMIVPIIGPVIAAIYAFWLTRKDRIRGAAGKVGSAATSLGPAATFIAGAILQAIVGLLIQKYFFH